MGSWTGVKLEDIINKENPSVAKTRNIFGDSNELLGFRGEILEQPGGRRFRARKATFRGKPNVEAKESLCNTLSDEMYKSELYDLASELGLPVTKKLTKSELCDMISSFVREEIPLPTNTPENIAQQQLDHAYFPRISDTLRKKYMKLIGTYFDLVFSQYSYFDFLYSPEIGLIDMDNIISSQDPELYEQWKGATYGEYVGKFLPLESLEIIRQIPEEQIRNNIRPHLRDIETAFETNQGRTLHANERFTEEDVEEILGLHNLILTGLFDLDDPVKDKTSS